jgi:hypothetical protein
VNFSLRAFPSVDKLQFGKRVTVLGSSFLAMGLFLTACGKRDSKTSQLVVGTWLMEGEVSREVSLDANGTFHSQSRASSNRSVEFFGTWKLSGDNLLSTTTNVVRHGLDGRPPNGAADTFRIVHLDASRLALHVDGRTNEFVRK